MRFMSFVAVLILLAAGAGLWALHSFNHFAEIERVFDGQCQPVRGIAGPEDIVIDPRRARAFLSSLDRRQPDARGAIHLFDLSDPLNDAAWRDRTGGFPADFQPLGLDYYEDAETRRLFVVNAANNSVEMFAVADDGGLTHLETFAERRMTSPNNVVAVGRRSFYVTNDVKPGRDTRMGDLHFLTRAASGQILYTDGTVWRVAAEGLRFANGVDLSPDGRRLYAAETAGGAIQVFERDAASGALARVNEIKLAAAPDNLMVDEAGAIWVAALPKPLAAPRHAANPQIPAPSEVIRIGADGAPRTVYRDNGTELSASTAAARLDATLMIGALYDETFLICRLPERAF
ncbi:MAG: SMP-30/gluconolactonase/LRE family protein [Hyphococcus sp.]